MTSMDASQRQRGEEVEQPHFLHQVSTSITDAEATGMCVSYAPLV